VRYYPVFLDLSGRKVVVVGGGRVAEQKVRSLLASRAEITVISPALTGGLKTVIRKRRVRLRRRPYRSGDLRGSFLVFAATNDPALQKKVASDAARSRSLVNVADRPQLCTFISPSILVRGDLTVAISTGGKSPALAKKLRRDLGRQFGRAYGDFLKMMGSARKAVSKKISSQARRKKFWDRLMDSGLLELMNDGKRAEARRRLSALLLREGVRPRKGG